MAVEPGTWKSQEVRAPTVLEEDGRIRLWFAGNQMPKGSWNKFQGGIGYAEKHVGPKTRSRREP